MHGYYYRIDAYSIPFTLDFRPNSTKIIEEIAQHSYLTVLKLTHIIGQHVIVLAFSFLYTLDQGNNFVSFYLLKLHIIFSSIANEVELKY